MKISNKKAQVGQTITWIVATVIIVLILTISILVSNFAFKDSKEIHLSKRTDVLASKSLFSYLLTKDATGSTVYNQLKNQENLNDFNGNLGKTIFLEFYNREYEDIWLGFPSFPASNQFFGKRPTGVKPSDLNSGFVSFISEKIYLTPDKILELYLAKKGSIK